jgi:hypothetical protein
LTIGRIEIAEVGAVDGVHGDVLLPGRGDDQGVGFAIAARGEGETAPSISSHGKVSPDARSGYLQ